MKGIKTILGALAAASLLFSVNAFAQENNNRDENGNVVRGAYETNKAFDNTFIGIGAGVNSVVTISKSPAIGNLGIAADLNFGKWWTPAVGMRVGYHGLFDAAKKGFTSQKIGAGDTFGFHYGHADLLWNISNSIGGYKETRVWNFVPYATMGVLDVTKGKNPFKKGAGHNLEYAAGVGLLNVIRLGERVSHSLNDHGIFHYADLSYAHLLELAGRRAEPLGMCHPALLKLLAHDERRGSELAGKLEAERSRQWYERLNAAKAKAGEAETKLCLPLMLLLIVLVIIAAAPALLNM